VTDFSECSSYAKRRLSAAESIKNTSLDIEALAVEAVGRESDTPVRATLTTRPWSAGSSVENESVSPSERNHGPLVTPDSMQTAPSDTLLFGGNTCSWSHGLRKYPRTVRRAVKIAPTTAAIAPKPPT